MDFSSVVWMILACLVWIMQCAGVANAMPKKRHAKSAPKGYNQDNTSPAPMSTQESLPMVEAWYDQQDGKAPSLGTGNAAKSTSCCLNGGLCVMGAFCHCPDEFMGQRCEYPKYCGPIEHEQWARVGCNLCICNRGQLLCYARTYAGCESDSDNEDIQVEDYLDNIELFDKEDSTSADYEIDQYSDDDYYDYDSSDPFDNYDDYDTPIPTKPRSRGKSRNRHRNRGKGNAACHSYQPFPLLFILLYPLARFLVSCYILT